MTDRATAHSGGQAAVGDISNSTHAIAGSVGVIGNGTIGTVIIQNLNFYFGLPPAEIPASQPRK